MLSAKLSIVFGSKKSTKNTVVFDDSEDVEAVQKKVAKAAKKKTPPQETLSFDLTQVEDGVLIADAQTGWRFKLPKGLEKSFNFPWSRIFACEVNNATSAVLEVDGVAVFASSGPHVDVEAMVEAFTLLDGKIPTYKTRPNSPE
jgi:hypothetical protein